MNHREFVAAYGRGEIRVEVDPKGAARFLSERMLLPFVTMPVLGLGVALALIGWIFTGLGILALGIVVPRLIKRSAPHFVFQSALEDGRAYAELTRTEVLRVTPVAVAGRSRDEVMK